MTGSLILVATPIGNLGDISERALETLRSADVIACEDTRHTRKLLTHHGVRGPKLMAVHEHNEQHAAAEVSRQIGDGATIALVTDAGMPAISDPGERVVAAVAQAGWPITAVPGPSAVVCALALSGLPTQRFCFEGFPPRAQGERISLFESLARETRTMVFYESPSRIAGTVRELASAFGDERRAALARELTKMHEEVRRMTLAEMANELDTEPVKGECVLVVEGRTARADATDDEIVEALQGELKTGVTKRDATTAVAEMLSVSRRRVYELANSLQ